MRNMSFAEYSQDRSDGAATSVSPLSKAARQSLFIVIFMGAEEAYWNEACRRWRAQLVARCENLV
jgi:hypothetical protein